MPGVAKTLGWLLLAVAWPGLMASGSPALQVRDFNLEGRPFQVARILWQGRTAVSVVTRPSTGASTGWLNLLRFTASGLERIHRWPLPQGLAYAEPWRLPGGEVGWLGWINGRWHLGRAAGDRLAWQPLCDCDAAFPPGRGPDRLHDRFIFDLDGDGVDEALLPQPGALAAYRPVPPEMVVEPVGRLLWNGTGQPLPPRKGGGYEVPTFTFRDIDGDGRLELLLPGSDRLLVAVWPRVAGTVDYGWSSGGTAGLPAGYPEALRTALSGLDGRRFPDARAFLDALHATAGQPLLRDWYPYLPGTLALARAPLADGRPYAVPFAGLKKPGKDDELLVLNMTDMDGDGVLDVLHATLLNKGSVFGQRNELRWYRGSMEQGRLTFAAPDPTIRSDGGSFALLVRPHTDDRPPLSLVMASAEVNLASLMKALASREVSLDVKVYPWVNGRLAGRATTGGEFTYEALTDKGRRAHFVAADLDGDGTRDYLLNLKPDGLRIYLSSGAPTALTGPALFQGGLPLPSRSEYIRAGDLDGGGREELLIWYRKKYHPALAHTLRVAWLAGK